MEGSGSRRARRLACLLLLALVVHLPAPAWAVSSGLPAGAAIPASATGAMAQPVPPTVQPSPSPIHTPGPIVPRGNPVGTVGIVAMVVAAAAGLWIYRVIRKGL